MRRIDHVERQRLRTQLQILLAAAERDEASGDPARGSLAAWRRRDAERLQAAVEGRRPSAVFGHEDPPELDDEAMRIAIARHDAAHAADNALIMLGRVDPDDPRLAAAVTRAARWLLRLDLELADVPDPPAGVDAAALALSLLAATPDAALLAEVRRAVEQARDALRAADARL